MTVEWCGGSEGCRVLGIIAVGTRLLRAEGLPIRGYVGEDLKQVIRLVCISFTGRTVSTKAQRPCLCIQGRACRTMYLNEEHEG
jgi:hypothetical protein